MVYLNGKPLDYPSPRSGYYNGQRIWNLNPGDGVTDGNFTLPFDRISGSDDLEIIVTVAVIGDGDYETWLLPLGWKYMHKENDWYLDPSPLE